MKLRYTSFSLFPCLLSLMILALPALQSCKNNPKQDAAQPKPMSEEEEEEMQERKKAYIELIHKAAPGTDWRAIEEQNAIDNYYKRKNTAAKTTSSFGGGAFNATWFERGNNNIAGRINSVAFLKSTSTLYAAADGGSIWKTPLPGISWVKVADNAQYNANVLGLLPRGATGARLFLSTGRKIWRTDNDGVSFDTCAGLTYPVAWGGNGVRLVIPVSDAVRRVYAVTQAWDPVSWTSRVSLYVSTDSGLNFTYLRNFAYNNVDKISFCSPEGSGILYALGVSNSGNDTLYTINAGVVTAATATSTFASGDNKVDMKCVITGGVTHFYALTGGSHIYHSTNFGANWLLKSTVSDAYIIGVSAQHPEIVSYGGVEAFRSTDSGASWTIINTWGSYYAAIVTKLHADLRDFSYFSYSSGAEFRLVSTDGGIWLSNDNLATVSNITLTGMRNVQLWDHVTSPIDTNVIIGGAQDQGLQQTAGGGGTGLTTATQLISGDYGQQRISRPNNILWTQYPGGAMRCYENLISPGYVCYWGMTGTQKPNVGWLLATSNYFTSSTQDQILIGGGEISGDTGSYLVRLTLDLPGASVTPFQYNYNFRTNSNSGTSGIAAIGISKLSNTLMYVAAEDGTFFYSTNAGTSWNITPSFSILTGSYLYGSSILASVDSVDKVYFAGSGYSNPPVYVSRDHGLTFTTMSNGLPSTLVNTMAAYKNDSFVFAATEAGPYVYVKADNYWYSLSEPGVPVVNWRSVEYISSINTVRFGTYGRGIWDLRIGDPVIPPTSVNNTTSLDIKLAPNPVRSGGPLRLLSPIQQDVYLNVYSMSGARVFGGNVTTNEQINLPDLRAGMYLCEMTIAGKAQYSMVVVNSSL